MANRVVVTGLGVVSPTGAGVRDFWDKLCQGQSGIAEITAFDVSNFTVTRGGEIKDFNPVRFLSSTHANNLARTSQLAVAAAQMAKDDANITSFTDKARVGVCIGTTMGNQSVVEDDHDIRINNHPSRVPPPIFAHPEPYISASVSRHLGAEGPSTTIPTACAAGNYAIGQGSEWIQSGLADIVFVGGSDGISRSCFALFHRLGAMAPEICQPFDKNRKGMMVSEGAGVLVLENLETALERGAPIYAELLGYGLACDAHHPTAPHPEGLGAQIAMNNALKDAKVEKEQISYISAHGTGTPANDLTESMALKSVFGSLLDQIPTSSIKSMLGHTMGAASAIEAVSCALSIKHQVLPPTMNYSTPDPECITNVIPNQSIARPVHTVLSNSFAFGGNICSIILGEIANVE
ncbi:beta-ketoacyl-[acyl-carrier-protein] synthase family protein [Paenibacillus medicaginis]|uniref:Beta-ketoacyl-[acyl-carrier-protein] synthase family protein n=1 Tax=Paenibacillus medicaginis TaxID=1470560 RepID=A0ABV5BW33_9BACL